MTRLIRVARVAVTFIVAAGGLLGARSANAQDAGTTPDCTTLTNPVYLIGSSAYEATLKAFAVKLSASTEAAPITVVYQKPGSCVGVAAIAAGTKLTGTGIYYTTNGTTVTSNNCTFPSAGVTPDVGVSDVFYESCTTVTGTKPAALGDFFGPVQAMEFIVAKSNTATAYLTAQEAQDIWGCGASAGIGTFTMAAGIFCRNNTSGTQIIIADSIGLPPASTFIGTDTGSSGTMASDVATFATPTASIGFIGADTYDANRATLNALAFEAFGQTKAYYADSAPAAVDRQNVRDGHYFPWGYEHLFTPVNGSGAATDTKAATIIGLLTGTKTDSSFDYVQVDAKAGTIPLCAMSVQKANDAPGYLAPYTPAGGDVCNCAFVAAASGTAPSSCLTCSATDGGNACTGSKSCHHGFCE
jgi:hypothetical protein